MIRYVPNNPCDKSFFLGNAIASVRLFNSSQEVLEEGGWLDDYIINVDI